MVDKKISNLNLDKLLSFDGPSILRRVDPELGARLKNYPETLERIEGLVYFCGVLGNQNDTVATKVDLGARRKFLRAALAEFASLEDAVAIDFKISNKFSKKMCDIEDPRVHIVRLLRHANVHLAISNLEQSSRNAVWREQEFEFQVFYSKDVKSSILQTRQAARYLDHDLMKMISWVEREQMEWGMDHLILKTAEVYLNSIIDCKI